MNLTGVKAPQKQCKSWESHPVHHWIRPSDGLVWWCQGRGQR
jgi:hypothetical protein